MLLPMYIGQINQALQTLNGNKLSSYIEVFGKQTERMLKDSSEPDYGVEVECRRRLDQPWSEVVYFHIIAARAAANGDFVGAYNEQNNAVMAFLRDFPKMTNWSLEALYTINKDLCKLAAYADKELERKGETPTSMEDCARVVNKTFTACVTDRSPIELSKKWGTYNVACVLFRTYFKLKSHSLCKNIIRAIKVSELPDLSEFPMAHQVTMRYYTGVLSSFDEDFAKAELDLQFAFDHTPPVFHKHRRLILHYLIPVKLLRGSLPSVRLLQEFPELNTLYAPLLQGIKTGNVQAFDDGLAQGADRLMAVGQYLTVEMARGLAMRTLFKKVFTTTGASSKVDIRLFQTALAFVGVTADLDEVECMLANMIYKKYIRGYISQEKRVLVLSKGNPFPSLSTIQ
ncbi:COP9 signalosome (CSN) subunit [Mortierella claussenii]|nr:COP9 signalosome (CSN) subunit [Mortierella claussenii]